MDGEYPTTPRQAMKRVTRTILSIPALRPIPTPEAEQNLSLGKGFGCEVARRGAYPWGFTPHIHHRGEGAKAYRNPGHPARRWVIERTSRWINRFRRIPVRWEERADNCLAMLDYAMSIIICQELDRANALFR